MSSQQAAVVPQASILAVAKGIASKVTPNAMTFGLAVDVYEDMAVTGYNHFWLQKIEKNEDCLAEFTSKHKLDVLVRVGALQVGDELFVNPEHTDENGVVVFSGERAAKVSGRLVSWVFLLPLQDVGHPWLVISVLLSSEV